MRIQIIKDVLHIFLDENVFTDTDTKRITNIMIHKTNYKGVGCGFMNQQVFESVIELLERSQKQADVEKQVQP